MKKTRMIILYVILLTVIAVGCVSCQAIIDKKTWNDGKCICGGEYEFSNVDYVKRGEEYYYYRCTACGNIIKTRSPQK